jgi:zeaxanthin glucosyltransferase
MIHFGILCPGAIGHLNPSIALGRELIRRGHRVSLLGVPDVQAKIAHSGLEFIEIGAQSHPLGTLPSFYRQLGQLDGLAGVKFSVNFFNQEAQLLLSEAPAAIQAAGIEALIVDQTTFAGGSVADRLQLPFITLCNALLLHREPGVPPFFTLWPYRDSFFSRLRNRLGNRFLERMVQPIHQTVAAQRQQWQLPLYTNYQEAYSPLAQICQLPQAFDFPRQHIPTWLHYVGPLQDPSGQEMVQMAPDFPWERLTGQPLIYASLGTLQNQNWELFQLIAAACEPLAAQLVISLGNPEQDPAALALAGQPLVVSYAPHQQLIQRSSLVVTHGGLNTTIGTLSVGIPLVAIPITNEQPGIAARLARTGAGQALPLKGLTASKLRAAIAEVLQQPRYRQQAQAMQASIQQSGGVRRAAEIIEQALHSVT